MNALFLPSLLLVACALGGPGCRTVQYYGQAIEGQWELVSKKQAIPKLIADSRTAPDLRRQLQGVQQIIEFAETQLGLPVEGAYGDYVDLQRPYVVWNVMTAPEFSLEAGTWWYPLVGRMEYRGYFRKELALEHAERLREQGQDVFVGGVPAYSTLGWFDDPVLNTFVADPETELAELLFHELAHRRFYVSGDTDFNEAFATAVGREGVRRWMISRGDADATDAYRQRRQRDDQVIALILAKRDELKQLYETAGALPTSELRGRKQGILESLRDEYRNLKRDWPGYRAFDKFMAAPLNNARLNAVDTYFDLVPKFEKLIASRTAPPPANDLGDFFQFIESTRHMDHGQRRCFLDQHAGAPRTP